MDAPLHRLHVDDSLIAVCKPAGLLAVPGRGAAKADCLWARVRAVHADALVVHRLDQATSGLMLFARGAAAQLTFRRSLNAFARNFPELCGGRIRVRAVLPDR